MGKEGTMSSVRRARHLFQMGVLLLGGLFLASGTSVEKRVQEVTLKTTDGVKISATLHYPARKRSKKSPAVILIHQGGSDRTEWDPYVNTLLDSGYITCAYDVRGHGKSDKVASISALFNDPEQAPNDLKAVLHHLRSLESVDGDRVAVVGASIGANLACVAAGDARYGIKTAVAISAKTSAVHNLAGDAKNFHMRSVFYISSMEQNGRRARWAKELYDETGEPRKLEIVPDSRSHGVRILKDAPGLVGKITSWLAQTL